MKTVHLKLEGMTCAGCARQVRAVLESVEGTEKVRVDYPAGRGTVELTGSGSEQEVIHAVGRAGYTAEVEREGGMATATEASSGSEAGPEGGGGGAGDFDLLIIGTGGAGMAAAVRGAELGARVAIAEAGTVGGMCVNVGCIPSKNLIAAAGRVHTARGGFPGIEPSGPSVDWQRVIDQKTALVDELRQGKYLDVLDAYPEITLLRGRARLLGDGRVAVDNVEHRARKVVVATGASPWQPPVPGLAEVEALTSTTAMTLEALPESMIVLGGGFVGLELGQTFSRFGTRVTILQRSERIATGEDPEISEALRQYLAAEGLEIRTGVQVERVERDGSEIIVHARQDGRDARLRTERILIATGRRANTRDLGLDEVGIERDARGFVRTDPALRTTAADIYAAGDVAGGPGFVYTAARDGRIAAENALTGTNQEIDGVVPRVMFTDPQVAAVGMSGTEARDAGREVDVRRLDLEDVPRALVEHDTRGFIKIVAERGTGRVLGVHAVTPHAGELTGEATLAVRVGLTVQDLAETLHPYLTWGEGLKLAAQAFTKDVAKLSCCA